MVMEYLIRYQGGFYNRHWSPLEFHEATRFPTREDAEAKAATLPDPAVVVSAAEAMPHVPMNGYTLTQHLDVLKDKEAAWKAGVDRLIHDARTRLGGETLTERDLREVIAVLSEALTMRAQMTGYGVGIQAINDSLVRRDLE